jgi:phosphatidate cytidylyltransferase
MTRWITGIIMSIVLILLLAFAPPLAIKAIMVALAAGGCWELLGLGGEKRFSHRLLAVCLVVYGVVGLSWFKDPKLLFLFFFAVIVFAFVSQFAGDLPSETKTRNTYLFLFSVIYMVVPWGLFSMIMDRPNFRYWMFFAVAATALGDTFAYLVGRSYGKHKLAPVISPNKTVEGLIGALFGGMAAGVVLKQIFAASLPWTAVIVLGALTALMGALGDLGESLIKRGYGVKDSGTIIPGHGGILDRVDAVLFAGPFVYFVSQCF